MVNSVNGLGCNNYGVNFGQTLAYNPSAVYGNSYVQTPVSDTYVSSAKAQTKTKKSNPIGTLIKAAILVAGGSAAARKLLPAMKNYTKVLENATLKQKAMNIIATIGDKTIETASKVLSKAKNLMHKTPQNMDNTGQLLFNFGEDVASKV